jgi:hypothetical protein
MREDGLPDRRNEVFPALVGAASEPQHALEKRDRSFDAGAESLRMSEERIALACGLGRCARTFLRNRDYLDRAFELVQPPPEVREELTGGKPWQRRSASLTIARELGDIERLLMLMLSRNGAARRSFVR